MSKYITPVIPGFINRSICIDDATFNLFREKIDKNKDNHIDRKEIKNYFGTDIKNAETKLKKLKINKDNLKILLILYSEDSFQTRKEHWVRFIRVRTLRTLISGINDINSATRLNAIIGLGEIGIAAKETAPQLANLLKTEKTVENKQAIIRTLGKIGYADNNIVSILVSQLHSENDSIKSLILATLVNFTYSPFTEKIDYKRVIKEILKLSESEVLKKHHPFSKKISPKKFKIKSKEQKYEGTFLTSLLYYLEKIAKHDPKTVSLYLTTLLKSERDFYEPANISAICDIFSELKKLLNEEEIDGEIRKNLFEILATSGHPARRRAVFALSYRKEFNRKIFQLLKNVISDDNENLRDRILASAVLGNLCINNNNKYIDEILPLFELILHEINFHQECTSYIDYIEKWVKGLKKTQKEIKNK
ncbi:MAG: HEAT repeat domain-containing protein [Armatimonadota bacterium]